MSQKQNNYLLNNNIQAISVLTQELIQTLNNSFNVIGKSMWKTVGQKLGTGEIVLPEIKEPFIDVNKSFKPFTTEDFKFNKK